MNKKAVSPVIATVLLIAITIVLIVTIFLWTRGFVPEVVQKSIGNEQMPANQACQEVSLETNYDSSSGALELINNGQIPIFSLNIIEKSASESSKASVQDSELQLPIGETASVSLTPNLNSIEISPIILGTNKEGAKRTYVCSENKIIV